jgi:hypothetical protein
MAALAHNLSVRRSCTSVQNDQTDVFRIMLATFLVNVEVSIVGTSLITIANSLHSFSETGWIVTGYLVTYTSKYSILVLEAYSLILKAL